MQQFILKMGQQNSKEKLNLDSIEALLGQQRAPTFQTLLSNSILPRLFNLESIQYPYDINTWIQAIRIANRLLDIGIDVNSLYQGNNILNNILKIYSELEAIEMNEGFLSLDKKLQDLMIRVIKMGVDPNHSDNDGEHPLFWSFLFNPNHRACRDRQSIKVFDELILHGALPGYYIDYLRNPSFFHDDSHFGMLQRMQNLLQHGEYLEPRLEPRGKHLENRANILINNYLSGQLSQQKFKSNPEITKQILQTYLKTSAQTQQQLFQKLAVLKQQRARKIIQQAAQRSVAQQAQRAKKRKQTFTQQQLAQIKVFDFISLEQVPIKEFLEYPNSIVVAAKQPSGAYEFHGFLLNVPNMVYTCANLSNQQYLRQKDGLTTALITLKTNVEFRIPRDELLPKLKEGYNVFFVETSPEKVKIISKNIILGADYVSGVHCTDKDVFNISHIVDCKKVDAFVPDVDLSYYQRKV
uniref:Uncharacterized protein n=1 Tax=viral metagenome TaxID=1070528 RepID=A0A6C0K180_9ZZZZ